jgi:hypothetical protein
MSDRATFSPSMQTAKDRMRFKLGDTNVNVEKAATADAMALPVDDDVYLGLLAYHGEDERQATIELAEALVSKYAQQETEAAVEGQESAKWGNLLAGWRGVATRLRAEIAAEETRRRAGFSVLRPTRAGAAREGGEYYAGRCRLPWED